MSDGRPLTPGEVDLARSIYGDLIDYSEVTIYNRKWFHLQADQVTMAPNGNIYFPNESLFYRDDFSAEASGSFYEVEPGRGYIGVDVKAHFIHEVGHVFQAQHGVPVVLRGVIEQGVNPLPFIDVYDFEDELADGDPFHTWGIEEQADYFSAVYYQREHFKAFGFYSDRFPSLPKLEAIAPVNIRPATECFLPGTPVAMWDAPDRPIEAVALGDLVVSYDRAGRLVPGRVSRVFANEVRVILDLFGLMVTPGHVTLCGEGPHAGRHVPVLDILRTDGALVMRDGTLVRAATGCPVGSEGDAWVAAVVGEPRPSGRVHVTEARHIRAGTRVVTADGRDVSVLEAIRAAGGEVGPNGWVRPRGEPEAEGMPFHWAFSERLPAPEDYVLARSGTTLGDIYAAGEWEAVPPQGPAPEGAPKARPAPNVPLALRGQGDPLAARGGAFAPSEAAQGRASARTPGALPH